MLRDSRLSSGLPDLVRVRQRFPSRPSVCVARVLEQQWSSLGMGERIAAGARVALTAGGRGVRDMVPTLRTVADLVRQAGGSPFVVPCMGSHGGATAAGQREVLAALGVTEEGVRAPLLSSMDVVQVGESRFGTPVWVARDLAEADAVVVVNRVKSHTDFSGSIESGLVKMLVIGAGKHRGAEVAHRLAVRHGFPTILEESATIVLERLPVLCGIALVQDEHERTAEVHVVPAAEIVDREPLFLARAEAMMPAIPFESFDCLLLDEIGKEISGAGMDSKVIGRINVRGAVSPEQPRIRRIVVRDLTPASHGNAIGIGSADFTTTRLLATIDREATAVNCITSTAPESGRLPIAFDRDVDALKAACQTSGAMSPSEFSLVWLRNTLSLSRRADHLERPASRGRLPGEARDPRRPVPVPYQRRRDAHLGLGVAGHRRRCGGDMMGQASPDSNRRLQGKVAIVTGGASGIGAAIARRFAAEGAYQVLVGLPAEAAKAGELVDRLGHEAAVFVAGDITDPGTAEQAATAARERFGRLDILVNNAGIDYSGVSLLDSELHLCRRVMDVNFFGALQMLQSASRAMLVDRPAADPATPRPAGSIVNTASRAGVVGVKSMAVYGATKAALISLTRSAALELAPSIRVNAVAPGATETAMIRTWIDDQDDPCEFERALTATIPMGRLARPGEIAQTVLFLASDEATHIAGTVLPVDGGYTSG